MPAVGKPDATGRSSGKRTGRAGKAHRRPKGEPWVWLTRELLTSPAWRDQSVNTARLIAERSERELVRAWSEQLEAGAT